MSTESYQQSGGAEPKANKTEPVNTVIRKQEVATLNEYNFMRVDEVASELGVSKSYAYKIVQMLNVELKEMGYITISGRVNRKYFMKKLCYGETERKNT